MITAKQCKSLYYLDRDSDVGELVEKILAKKKQELYIFIERKKNELQPKEAGEFFTLEDVLKCKDGGLEKMQYFFRAAVVPYYIRQEYDFWDEKIPIDMLIEGTKKMKRSVGFTLYDHTGKKTDEVNSMTTFKTIKQLNEFITDLENVCFVDNDYFFPDSKHFNALVEKKGRKAAKRQVLSELQEKWRNRFQGRLSPSEV